MSEDYSVARFDDVDPEVYDRAGAEHVDLAAALDGERMRPRIWTLGPGEAVTYHRQTRQEELYVPLQGPGRLRVGDDLLDVGEWSAVVVPPETPRQILNDTASETHVWLVVASPAVENDGQLLGERGEIHRPD